MPETIAVAIAEPDREVRSLDDSVPCRIDRKLIKKLGPAEKLRICCEAGPTGYVVYWQLVELGIPCEVVAPTLVPVKAGDRVKTDARNCNSPLCCESSTRCRATGADWLNEQGFPAMPGTQISFSG
jgi:transposase